MTQVDLETLPVSRVLVVVAHPDDIESWCAGTVCRFADSGKHVCYVLCTSLAGLLLLRVGAAGCFFLNTLSFLAVLIALAMIAIANANLVGARSDMSATLTIPRPKAEARPIKASFREFGTLSHEPAILAVLGIAAATSLLGRPYLLLMPAFHARIRQQVCKHALVKS